MVDFERKVGPKGQVVIPKEIRRITGVRPDSEVLVTLEDKGIVIRKRIERLSSFLEESVKKDGKFLGKINSDKLYDEQMAERTKRKL